MRDRLGRRESSGGSGRASLEAASDTVAQDSYRRPPHGGYRALAVLFWLIVPVLAQAGPTSPPPSRDTQTSERRALSEELEKLWTRDPELLVSTVADARDGSQSEMSLSFLLAIAHAETNGKVLIVSEAGAVGLAQATPIAYLKEGFSGKVYITADYLIAARAYIMKKPLGDASGIASRLAARCDSRQIAKAHRLLESAFALRREGMDDLQLLARFAADGYVESLQQDDERNAAVLLELDELLRDPDAARLEQFSERVELQYQELKAIQRTRWRRYQDDLADRRDQILRQHFSADPELVKRTRAYEAGELLGRELDARFSPTEMAQFLVRHVATKRQEAKEINASADQLDRLTAALYNGGSPNVLRMNAGLIKSIKETERYMRKVPATRRLLDSSIRRRVRTQPAGGYPPAGS